MAPVTRSMTLARYDGHKHLISEDERKAIMCEIRRGINNVEYVKGFEYKKYMVYALFDYMCDIEPSLYVLGKKFGKTIRVKLDEFLEYYTTDEDVVFHDTCLYYKEYLCNYFEWCESTYN